MRIGDLEGGESCFFPGSRLAVRGPVQNFRAGFGLAIGGSGTFARGVARPYPALLAQEMGWDVANFGCQNAGPDAFLQDPGLMRLMGQAGFVVFQAPGALNMTNRYYQVHPRRNDRFLAASPLLTDLFPEVDFTEFAFTRHLLGHLERLDARRFGRIVQELRAAWVGRMLRLVRRTKAPTVLLWLADRPAMGDDSVDMTAEHALVTERMLSVVEGHTTYRLDVICPGPALRLYDGLPVASAPVGAEGHARAAVQLGALLSGQKMLRRSA